jgi:hypothetical protein
VSGTIVRTRIKEIEDRLKPALRGKDQVLGFCTALSAVLEDFGPDTILNEGVSVEVIVPLEIHTCPDCGIALRKCRAETETGGVKVAWVCDCDPDDLPPAPVAGSETEDL